MSYQVASPYNTSSVKSEMTSTPFIHFDNADQQQQQLKTQTNTADYWMATAKLSNSSTFSSSSSVTSSAHDDINVNNSNLMETTPIIDDIWTPDDSPVTEPQNSNNNNNNNNSSFYPTGVQNAHSGFYQYAVAAPPMSTPTTACMYQQNYQEPLNFTTITTNNNYGCYQTQQQEQQQSSNAYQCNSYSQTANAVSSYPYEIVQSSANFMPMSLLMNGGGGGNFYPWMAVVGPNSCQKKRGRQTYTRQQTIVSSFLN